MDTSILNEILRGGLEKVHEAGAIIVGGHTVEDDELKYGLSVTGVIHPSKVVLNTGARAGDRLILTKPLGTGIISTAIKGGVADASAEARIVKSMTTLNRKAAELMQETGVHAATDVTGFGLLGHASEMIDGSDTGIVIHSAAVPFFPEARKFAEMGMLPGGLHRNRDFRAHMVTVEKPVPDYLADILFDAQTSGGLLISVASEKADGLLDRMHKEGIREATLVDEVVPEPKGKIIVD